MNPNTRHPHERDAAEWALQERARAQVNEPGAGPADEPALRDYLRIAQALRREPDERLPSNFAWQVAQRATRLPRRARIDLRLERWLLRALVCAMGLGAVVVATLYGAGWVTALQRSGAGADWSLLLGACVALALVPEAVQAWRRRRP